ncbi:hypothetical protein Tco_0580659 [Tanacetum coccineum]
MLMMDDVGEKKGGKSSQHSRYVGEVTSLEYLTRVTVAANTGRMLARWLDLGDDDNFLLTMRGLPKSVSWLGSHIKSLIAAMYNENKEGLQQLLELRNYTNNDVLLLHPEDEDVISVAAFVASWITVIKSEDLVVASH